MVECFSYRFGAQVFYPTSQHGSVPGTHGDVPRGLSEDGFVDVPLLGRPGPSA